MNDQIFEPYATAFGKALEAQRSSRLGDAEAGFRRAIAIDARQPSGHFHLGCVLQVTGRLEEATVSYQSAGALAPDVAEVHVNLGACRHALGRLGEAADSFRRAVAIAPALADGHGNLGLVYQDLGQLAEAEACLRRAVALRPGIASLHSNLGTVLRDLGRLDDAIAEFERALALDPNSLTALVNLGVARATRGEFDPAAELANFRRALQLNPYFAAGHDNLLMVMNYDPSMNIDVLAEAHREYGRCHSQLAPAIAPHLNDRDPERRLRIGYISADFRRHPVGYFLLSAFANHDRSVFEIYCYDCGVRNDDMTTRLRAYAASWRSVTGTNNDSLAAQIRADGIDILVDLAGHTTGNRLPVFARKPAPVQVTWIGYFFSTGLAAVDYALMDDTLVPPGGERWFAESVVRLPGGRFCYSPPDYAPAPALPPMLRNGYPTFGSFNSIAKLSPDVAKLWARVLAAVPDARLVLKWSTLGHEAERARVAAMFRAAGADPARLELRPFSPHAAMLAEYGDIDIALDPFPFSGGLTSCEALWMGVPVVTWPGERPVSRQTLGFLAAAGLDELVASSPEDYVTRAADLARDRSRLERLRREIRPRLAASPVLDHLGHARRLEAAYRTMWRQWCATGS